MEIIYLECKYTVWLLWLCENEARFSSPVTLSIFADKTVFRFIIHWESTTFLYFYFFFDVCAGLECPWGHFLSWAYTSPRCSSSWPASRLYVPWLPDPSWGAEQHHSVHGELAAGERGQSAFASWLISWGTKTIAYLSLLWSAPKTFLSFRLAWLLGQWQFSSLYCWFVYILLLFAGDIYHLSIILLIFVWSSKTPLPIFCIVSNRQLNISYCQFGLPKL